MYRTALHLGSEWAVIFVFRARIGHGSSTDQSKTIDQEVVGLYPRDEFLAAVQSIRFAEFVDEIGSNIRISPVRLRRYFLQRHDGTHFAQNCFRATVSL